MSSRKDGKPWRHQTKEQNNNENRRLWRVKARKLAKAAGFHTACDLCKRPIATEHRFGKVTLRNAHQWRSRLMQRTICKGCYLVLQAMIEQLEMQGAADHLPPEEGTDPFPPPPKDEGKEGENIEIL